MRGRSTKGLSVAAVLEPGNLLDLLGSSDLDLTSDWPSSFAGTSLLNLTPPPLDAQDDHLENWDRLRGDLERQRQLLHEEPSLQEEMEVLPPEKAVVPSACCSSFKNNATKWGFVPRALRCK